VPWRKCHSSSFVRPTRQRPRVELEYTKCTYLGVRADQAVARNRASKTDRIRPPLAVLSWQRRLERGLMQSINEKTFAVEQPCRPILRPIRVLALMEAASVTGPAKNLIEFATRAARSSVGVRAEIVVATYERASHRVPNKFAEAVRNAGIELSIINERFVFDPAVLGQLRSLALSRKFDIVQTHNCKSHFLVRLSGVHTHCRWIAFHHGYTTTNLKDRLYNQFDRWSLPAAYRVVTVCQSFACRLERVGVRSDRIAVQHNSVKSFIPSTPEEVAHLREALRIPPDARVVLAVGRLSHEKGHLDLIDAIARLRREEPRISFALVIVGDGPERTKLQRRAAALGVSSAVVFAGHRHDVSPFYTMADLIVLPSHSEGCPNVLLEAMTSGIAAVATSVGGVPEIVVDGRTATLVDKKDPKALAIAMARLLNDDNLRRKLAAAAREAALQHDPEIYCANLLQLYQSVVEQVEVRQSN
jgi:glycosyltransferase involved in cell wall biosynthesis